MEVNGEYNTADVKSEDGEDEAIDQIQDMMDAEAFEGDGDVAIMPDFHFGSGAVIGFTMPFKDRVAPATVGVDIGCGMTAVRLPGDPYLTDTNSRAELDELVRERVPVGFDVHNGTDYHMMDDFPWRLCATKLEEFEETTGFDLGGASPIEAYSEGEPPTFNGTNIPLYGTDYFTDLLKRVEYDAGRAINSVGTLGGGNHFIEIGEDPDAAEDPYWAVIHSGSRGLGATIAQYWIDRAGKIRNANGVREYFRNEVRPSHRDYLKFDLDTVSDEDLLDWVQGGMGEDYVNYDALKRDFKEDNPEVIGEISDALKGALDHIEAGEDPTAYLEGEEAHGYIVDMVFAQTYAQESRKQMAQAVLDAWSEFGATDRGAFREQVESIHNYIDFRDATIRKGACRAHEGERVIIPFNMKYGTLICRGKGDSGWNNSAPHGAGRAMSRTGAKQKFEQEDFEQEMADAGVYLSEHPLDEAPGAYKDPESIEEAIGPTVEVERRIKPLISIKAD